jgi:nicotinamidase-related amidase
MTEDRNKQRGELAERLLTHGATRRDVLFGTAQGVVVAVASGLSIRPGAVAAQDSGGTKTLQLDKKKTAVLAMDFQVVTVGMDAMTKERNVVGKAKTALEAARKAGLLVVLVHITFRPGYPEVSPRNKMFQMFAKKGMFLASDENSRIDPEIGPKEGDVLVNRPRVNPFYDSDLATILDSNDIDTLVMFGIATNWVVEAAARHASDADYRIVVLEDCCAAPSVEQHDASINYIQRWIGEIHTSRDFVAAVA